MIDFILQIPPGVWALIGTIFGGAGLKIVEKWLSKNSDRIAEKKDYREEIKGLQDRLDKVEDEVTDWRGKYYTAQEEIATLRTALITAGIPVPKP